MSFLLDTDICSAHLKSASGLSSRFIQYSGRLNISATTWGELGTWARRKNAPDTRVSGLNQLRRDVRLLEITEMVAETFANHRAE